MADDDNIPGHRIQPGLYEYDAPDGMYSVEHQEYHRPPNWYVHTPDPEDPSHPNPHPWHVYPSYFDARDGVQKAEHENLRTASDEAYSQRNGYIAIYPRTMDAEQLAYPGGYPPEHLHCTLVYFGDDVSSSSPGDALNALAQIADINAFIPAYVFAAANFNPTRAVAYQSAVYIVNASWTGDSPPGDTGGASTTSQYQFNDLTYLQQQTITMASQLVGIPQQPQPWIPFIAVSDMANANNLTFTGEIQFDRIGLTWMGETTYFHLAGA